MKLELGADEAREVLTLMVHRLAEEAGLSDGDRAQLRRWHSQEMRPGSAAMRELADKVNADLERALRTKEKSAVRKPDWV